MTRKKKTFLAWSKFQHSGAGCRSKYFSDESGVASVEMVILLATIVSVSISISTVVGKATNSLGVATAASIEEIGDTELATNSSVDTQEMPGNSAESNGSREAGTDGGLNGSSSDSAGNDYRGNPTEIDDNESDAKNDRRTAGDKTDQSADSSGSSDNNNNGGGANNGNDENSGSRPDAGNSSGSNRSGKDGDDNGGGKGGNHNYDQVIEVAGYEGSDRGRLNGDDKEVLLSRTGEGVGFDLASFFTGTGDVGQFSETHEKLGVCRRPGKAPNLFEAFEEVAELEQTSFSTFLNRIRSN